jgi:hypothetical protein
MNNVYAIDKKIYLYDLRLSANYHQAPLILGVFFKEQIIFSNIVVYYMNAV